MNKINEKIVSTTTWQDRFIIATEHHIYEIIDGEAVPMEFKQHDSMLSPEDQFEKKWKPFAGMGKFHGSKGICKDWFIRGIKG